MEPPAFKAPSWLGLAPPFPLSLRSLLPLVPSHFPELSSRALLVGKSQFKLPPARDIPKSSLLLGDTWIFSWSLTSLHTATFLLCGSLRLEFGLLFSWYVLMPSKRAVGHVVSKCSELNRVTIALSPAALCGSQQMVPIPIPLLFMEAQHGHPDMARLVLTADPRLQERKEDGDCGSQQPECDLVSQSSFTSLTC